MKRWRVLNVGSTEILLHPAVLAFAVYAFLLGYGRLWLLSVISVLLHEGAHAVVATLFKCSPSVVELTPMGAVMLLEDETKLPTMKRVLMIVAGPAISLCLAGLAVWATGHCYVSPSNGETLFLCNIAIVAINLLPVLPLDGGRLLHVMLCTILPLPVSARVLKYSAYIIGLALICLNIAVSIKYGGWNLSLAFAGCSILYSAAVATTTSKLRELRVFVERKTKLESKGYQTCKVMCVMGNIPIRHILSRLPANRQLICVVLEQGSMAMKGLINENEMIQHYLSTPSILMGEALFCQKVRENSPNMTQYEKVRAQNALTTMLCL